MRILLVDDDEVLTQTLASYLLSQHYAVDVATDGESGWSYAQAAAYDLIVLDIALPKLDGVRLCQKLRQHKCNSPVLLLTAKGNSADKVVGLDAGADDYLVKPCTMEELSARIRALLRRQTTSASPLLTWGNLCLDPSSYEVTYQGQLLSLSPKEYGLLELLLRSPKQTFSASTILEHLWGFGDAPGEETVRTHVKRLRQKLKSAGVEDMIDTVYGIGYRLKPFSEKTSSALTPTVVLAASGSASGASTPIPATPVPSVADQARASTIALWEQFKPPILERVGNLDRAVAALQAGKLSDKLRQTATTEAHKLAGSLGMFGFPKGSELAQAIEHWFQTAISANDIEQLQTLMAALHQDLERSPHPASKTPLPENPMRSSTITVLAVDDDPLVLAALEQGLPRHGIHSITLKDPLHLWEMLPSKKPDLLILDVDMPNLSGIELCRMIRNDKIWHGLPILFLTAHREPEVVLQLYNAGTDDYVAKPFTAAEVVTRIFNRLERNRQSRTWQPPPA